MDLSQLDQLNEQEAGFDLKKVQIDLEGVGKLECGVYIQDSVKQQILMEKFYKKNQNQKTIKPLPSYAYKMTCVIGATQQNVPSEYVETLRKWPDNGRKDTGPESIRYYFQ